jgi:hypothetical protein
MVSYGKTKVSVITIPKGTLLFRAVENPASDFEGVNGCMPPQYNVFFYFSPSVVDGLPEWYGSIQHIQVYVATHNLKVVSLISPSKFTRGSRMTKKSFMVPCNKTRKACLVPRAYDACFRDTFLEKNPSLLGWVGLGNSDTKTFQASVKQGMLGDRVQYVQSVKDARGLEGPPELALYPLKKRNLKDVSPPSDRNLYNYEHIRSIVRSGTELETFMNQHAEAVTGKWYYIYKA